MSSGCPKDCHLIDVTFWGNCTITKSTKSGQALLLLEEAQQFGMQLDVIFCSAVISACEKCEASKGGGVHNREGC